MHEVEAYGRADHIGAARGPRAARRADLCRQLVVSKASLHVCQKKYGKLDLAELGERRQPVDQNARLQSVVADTTQRK